MEGHTFISWNIPNTITIGLMGLVFAVVVMAGMRFMRNRAVAANG